MLLIYSISSIVIGVLCITLSILVIAISYRKLLTYLGKGEPNKADFAVLYSLENQPVHGEVEFFYELKTAKNVRLELLDEQMMFTHLIDERLGMVGGNIVRFDSTTVDSGNYFYQMVTENQKTSKKLRIENPR